MFYGEECPHCHTMMPAVDKLIQEGFDIKKVETWHNEENATLQKKVDTGLCGGVPFFFNEENKQWICGATDEETLRKWANGETVVK